MRGLILGLILAASAAAQPIGFWRFDALSCVGDTVMDRAGKRPAKTTGNPKVSTGAVLDGSRHRVTISEAADTTKLPQESFTVAAWVRIDAPRNWGGLLSCVEDNGADENGFILGYRGAKFMLGLATKKTGKITYLTGGPSMREGVWNHVVGTYDGKVMNLYVDGKIAATSNAQSGPIKYKPTQILALATYRDSNEHHGLTGCLYEVRLDAHAWSSADVARACADRPGALRDAPPSVEPAAPGVAGWPASMRDSRRSGVTAEELALPLIQHWWHEQSRPRSAWPPPAKGSFWQRLDDIKPRNVWDHAYHPVAVGGSVYYGSSADDRVWCLDASTGKTIWTFLTEGPVRFAPFVAGERLFFGSDDGNVYALNRATGSLIWKHRIGPSDRIIPGNGRLISPWPVRTGVAVDGDVVYATAGLFPREGCWVAAIDAENGKEIWKQRTDQSPQGYLLLSARALYVPTGRGTPFAVSRESGASLGSFPGPAGAYAVVAGNTLVSGRGDKGELRVSDTFAKDQLASFSGNRMLITPEMSYLQSDTHISALDRTRYLRLLPKSRTKRAEHSEQTRRYRAVVNALETGKPLNDADGKPISREDLTAEKQVLRARLLRLGSEVDEFDRQLAACVPWKVETRFTRSMILAGGTLFAGGDGQVGAYDARTGKLLWSGGVEGRAMALAVAEGRLIVGTSLGHLFAYGSRPKPDDASFGKPIPSRSVFPVIGSGLPKRGFVVSLGPEVRRGEFDRTDVTRVVSVEHVAKERTSRPFARSPVNLIAGPSTRLASGFADAVVVPSEDSDLSEAKRIVKPWGGQVLAPTGRTGLKTIWTRGQRFGSGQWTHMYADPANTACSNDKHVGSDLMLQWFGGPGPNPMLDRHLRTTAPLFRDGRLFIPGHDRIIAVDGCNGTVLWEQNVAGLSRTGAPYDGGHMAIGPRFFWYADGKHAIARDPDTGAVRFKSPIPETHDTDEWGWLAVRNDGALFGSVRHKDAAIRTTGREEVSRQYAEHQPLVSAHTLFRAGAGRKAAWTWRGGTILNTSLAVSGDAVYAIAGVDAEVRKQAGGRVKLADVVKDARIVSIDAMTGYEYWGKPFPSTQVTHSLFLCATPTYLIVTGSFTKETVTRKDDGTESKRLEAWYEVFCFKTEDGSLVWRNEHRNNVAAAGGSHGEQVHHPVIRGDLVFTEPVAYHIATGERWSPSGDPEKPWYIGGRRGCGTFSASESCLYFRNHNPIALSIGDGAKQTKITAVSRPGCWINILPVGGMVLLPEASSGCVCAFPIQTSMGFVPR